MTHFFYTRPEKAKDGTEIQMIDSFNVEYVIRSYDMGETLVVLLDDGHEAPDYVEVPKTGGKGTEWKKERRWIQSEVYLLGPDIDRFRSKMGYMQYLSIPLEELDNAESLEVAKTIIENFPMEKIKTEELSAQGYG